MSVWPVQYQAGRLKFGGQAAAVARLVQPRVVQRPAGGTQCQGEVAHGGQEQRDARLARPDMRGLFGNLCHPGRILRGIEAVEPGRVQIELIAEHEHQRAQLSHGRGGLCGTRRSRTSPQSSYASNACARS